MSAIAIDTQSTQGAKLTASNFQPLKANELSGRVRTAFFQYIAIGAQAANQVLGFTRIPKGARYLGGTIVSSGAISSAKLDVGFIASDESGELDAAATADDIDFIGDNLDIAATAALDLLDTEPAAFGYVTQKDVWIAGKLLTAGLADGDTLTGVVYYVTD